MPALKPTDFDGLILIDSPVRGLRPMRAARFFTLKVPKPTIETSPAFFRPFWMLSRTEATAMQCRIPN